MSSRNNHLCQIIPFPQMPRVVAARLAQKILEAEAMNDLVDQATYTDVRKFVPGIVAANEAARGDLK